VLVVDDSVEMARLLADRLSDAGYAVEVQASGKAALAALGERAFELVLADLRMEEVDGLDVLDAARRLDPPPPVIIMTAYGAIDTAITAMRRGAFHYLTKPFQWKEVLLQVERALQDRRLRDENRALRQALRERSGPPSLVGQSPPMQRLYEMIARVASSQAPVLIRGESGTGKELVARAVHLEGPRRERPFVPVNCTTLPESLLESELFGHVRGAFTSASSARRGLFLEADGGTLFLDEIGDMAPELQARLLRVVEDGEVRPVGSDSPRRVDVRIIAATHQDLEQRVREGRFRPDLFYRLQVVQLVLPPLAARTADIPALVQHFLQRARERNRTSPAREVTPELVSALARADWPGNVRQLENLMERLVVFARRPVLGVEDLQNEALETGGAGAPAFAQHRLMPLRDFENEYIAWVVAHCGGNKTRAAEVLGIDVSTIHRRERESVKG
jgi:two-component system response regulator HydG